MKKASLIIVAILCCVFSGICQQVTQQEAINAAVNTMRYYGRNVSNNIVDSVYTMLKQGNTLLYEVHFETGETVLLSGHKACVPVLGYITEGHGESILNQYDQIPDGLRDFVDEYAAYAQYFFDTISELEHLADWEALQIYNRDIEIHTVVEPLTKSRWGQDDTRIIYYFNGLHYDEDTHAYNYHILETCDDCEEAIYSPAGCTAIAMAQIMYYWKCPVFMEDSINQYKWCDMTDELGDYLGMGEITPEYANYLYDINRDAIATLIKDCAVRAHTNFCASSSCTSSSGPVRAKNAFKKFGYSNVDLKWKAFHERTWKSLLKEELDKGYPICYSSGSRTFTQLESVTETEDVSGYYRTIPQNTQAEYTAHKTIVLRAGFHAEDGSDFRAYITPCEACEPESRDRGESTRKDMVKPELIQQPLNVFEQVQPSKALSVYPNPNTGKFYIGLRDKQDSIKQVALFGIIGNQVIVEYNPQGGVVDISHIPHGIYVVRVLTGNGGIYYEKIIKG